VFSAVLLKLMKINEGRNNNVIQNEFAATAGFGVYTIHAFFFPSLSLAWFFSSISYRAIVPFVKVVGYGSQDP
jgi:hypothetical protein